MPGLIDAQQGRRQQLNAMNDTAKAHTSGHVRDAILAHLAQDVGVACAEAGLQHWLRATVLTVRDQIVQRWHQTNARVRKQGLKQVAYLSMEFLTGRELKNALGCLGLEKEVEAALAELSIRLNELYEQEPDPALGNGGLGRLAACFLDSMATVGVPGIGYGIRYEYGMFRQELADGWQIEQPDDWLTDADAWEFPRPERTYTVSFGGRVEHRDQRAHWVDGEKVLAVAFDRLVPGYDSDTVNTLRLWSPKPTDPIDLSAFNRGAFLDALARKIHAKTVGRVLYPDDSTAQGRELRLRQQYFFVSASVQDVLARFLVDTGDWDLLPRKVAIHLNDTHPALAPVELMHRLVDVHGVEWDRAWRLTQEVCAYTNHTLMPEALEVWPVELMGRLLPRHCELISEIERRFLGQVAQLPDAESVRAKVRLVEGDDNGHVNMGRLSTLASHRVNGVSRLHSKLVSETLFPEFARIFPGRIESITNGITQRRWLMSANPELSALLDKTIGSAWRHDFDRIGGFSRFADDAACQERMRQIKHLHKVQLARLIEKRTGVRADPDAMMDVHVKRIHEYKRQLLNILGVIARWNAIKADPQRAWVPRVVVLAGKAASAYWLAKRIIKLAYDVGTIINADPLTSEHLKLVFLPNYNVSLAEAIIPAADLSQQISLAGTEASGTGNMKLALNGALTIGTEDGANIEIADAVGRDNMFMFGLDVAGVQRLRATGYAPGERYAQDRAIRDVLDQISAGVFSPGEPERHRPIVEALLQHGDRYLVLADFAAFMAAQEEVDRAWADPALWASRAIRNVAGMARFSSDRAIREYADRIWGILPARGGI
jgi:glycogen phosphorylase